MKYCPKCGNKYDNDINFCLVDGEPLPKSDPEAQTLRIKPKSEDPLQAIRITGLGQYAPARVEYIVKKVWVDEGDTFDFITQTNIARITVMEIVEEQFPSGPLLEKKKEIGVKIKVNEIGAVYGGEETLKVPFSAETKYIVPVKGIGEESRSIFTFYARGKIALLFRVMVEQINTHHRRVELNIGYLWFGGD